MLALHESDRLAVPGRITLVDRGDALLGQFSGKAHQYAFEKLAEVGADVRLGTGVAAVHSDRVELTDGSVIPARTVVWGGGEEASRRLRSPRTRTIRRTRRSPRRPTRPHRTRLPRHVRRGRRGEHSIW
jgi:NADH dehydrogenase